MRKFALLSALFSLLFSICLKAQVTASFPMAPNMLTRGLDTSTVTANIGFTGGSCVSGTTVTLALPPGVFYVPGSVLKTGGTGGASASTITEALITNPNRPVFFISGVASIGDVTFSIRRYANCGTAASGNDTLLVNGCGTAQKTSISYDIKMPGLSFSMSPTVITNGAVSTSYSRSFTVYNGGFGCLDTLRMYVKGSNGIAATMGAYVLKAGTAVLTPYTSNGDTSFYKISGTVLSADNLLCNGESVVFTETFILRNCTATGSASPQYGASWGRPGGLCAGSSAGTTGPVTMATGVPGVLAANVVLVSGTNMCDSAELQVTITNNGTETVSGAGTAFNLIQRLGIDGGEAINVRAPLVISRIRLSNNAGGWVPLVHTGGSGGAATTISFSQLTADPDGAGGLIDADGDGQFDELPRLASITIRYKVAYTCQAACAASNHSGTPSFQSSYNNQCGTAYTGTRTSSGGGYNNRTLVAASQSGPTDINGGEKVTLRINFNRDFNITSSVFNCPTDNIILKMALPAGYIFNAGRYFPSGALSATNTISAAVVPSGVPGVPDTAVITGKRVSGGNYSAFAFEADVTLNCAVYTGAASLPYTISYSCDNSCTCEERWYCGSYSLNTHCPGPCALGGLTLIGSQFRRITGGYEGPNTTIFVKTDTLPVGQLRYAQIFDTVKGLFPGILNGGSPFVNHFFELSYAQSGSANILAGYSAVLRVKNKLTAAVSICTLSAPSSSTVSSGRHYITYALSACGLTINTNDSVWIEPLFLVLNNNALSATPAAINGLVTRYYSTTAKPGEQLTCDRWGGELYLFKADVVRNDGTGNIITNGCVNYNYNAIMYYAGIAADLFPREVRPHALLDSIRVYITSGDNFTGSYTLRAIGTNLDGYGASNIISQSLTPSSMSTDGKIATFRNDGTWAKADYVSGNGTSGHSFVIGLTTGCGSVATGSVTVTYYYKKFGYTHDAALRTSDSSRSGRGITSTVGTLALSNLSGPVQGVSPQQYWNVRISNPSAQASPFLWMALDKGVSGIIIDSVVYDAINQGTGISYGTGKNWYRIAAAGLASGATKDARIYFRYTSCNPDSIRMLAGWNCSAYPASPDTYPCSAAVQYLKIIPEQSEVQLSMFRQPGAGATISLCDNDFIETDMNSSLAANLDNPEIQIVPMFGFTVSSVEVLYPLNTITGTWQTISPLVPGGSVYSLEQHSLIGANGLPGTVTAISSEYRQVRVRVHYTTDCDFVTGSQLRFVSNGSRTCGAAALGSGIYTTSAPVNISGASVSGSAGVTINLTPPELYCNTVSVLPLNVTPVSTPTVAGDKVVYTLPPGIDYANGTFDPGVSGTTFGSVLSGPGGSNVVTVNLPAGVVPGTAINFSFGVRPNSTVACGNVPILGVVQRGISGLSCLSSGLTCASSVAAIGSGSQTVTIKKPLLNVSNISLVQSGLNVSYTVEVTNNGTHNAAAGYPVELRCGSRSGALIHGFNIPSALAVGSSVTLTGNFVMPSYTCFSGIYAVVGDTSCLCAAPAGMVSSSVLPIDLISFAGRQSECSAQFTWETGVETYISTYELQRSDDGNGYLSLATIPAKGSNSNYTVAVPNWTNGLFRLLIRNQTGKTQYSNVIPLKSSCTKAAMDIFPNPASGFIVVKGADKGNYIRLHNIYGQVLLEMKLHAVNQQIDVSNIPSGVYRVVVMEGDVVLASFKLIRQ